MSKAVKMLAALLLGTAASGATAGGLDGKGAMICAATTTIVCASRGECVSGTPEAVNLPTFWHVDPAAKVARSKRPGAAAERVSKITTVAVQAGKVVMQGSDDGFGWSVSVDAASGKMVLTGGSDIGYLVFGECTAP